LAKIHGSAATPITARSAIATRSQIPTAIRGPGPVRRSATAVSAAAMPTPQAASRLEGFASRFDWVITPGQAMVMHSTTDAAEPPITARRAAGVCGELSSRSAAGASSAGAASEIGQPRSTSTRAAPAPWLADTTLALDPEGFIRVRETLQSVSHPEVFAAGDIAAIEGHSPPKSGVYAVRAGEPLADNLRRLLAGKALIAYKPHFGIMIPLVLMTSGRWRAFGAAAVTIAFLTLATLIAFGPQVWDALFASTPFTRVIVLYRVSNAFAHPISPAANVDRPAVDARFDVQVRQSLPFMDFSTAKWEMLVGVRNFFRDIAADQSVYDELLVVRPPKRVIGGLTLKF